VPWSEKLPSGRYRASYRDAHGKARSAGTFPNKKAATNAAAVAESEARKLGYKDPRAGLMLWGDWVEVWWPTRQVEPGTAARDRSRLVRLSTKWETVPLVSITRHDVKLWLSELSADGLAPATVQRHLSLFSASLRAAIDAEIIQTNPAYRIQIAKGETLEHRYLTRPEFAALVRKIPDDFDKAIVSTLVGTGMRWGEAIGLQVQRIDFDRGVIRVAEGWDDKMRRVKPYPKGRKVRDVPLAPWVAAYLEPLAGDRRTGNVWAPEGNPPDYHNWRRRVWLPALKDAKLTDVRIHDLRHTFASWLIQDGVPLEEVGRLLGHVSPLTTRIYAHLAESPKEQILAALTDPTRGADVEQSNTPTGSMPRPVALLRSSK
jgi:integrase